MSVADRPPSTLYALKLKFLENMKSRIAHQFDELASSPHSMSKDTRIWYLAEANLANEMFDLIYEDIARLRDLDK